MMIDVPTTPITESEFTVRDLVGRWYDQGHGEPSERFNSGRALAVTALPTAYEHASHVAISLRGTPTRGLIVVEMAHFPPSAVDVLAVRSLRFAEAVLLRSFIVALSGTALEQVPRDFRWASRDDVLPAHPKHRRTASAALSAASGPRPWGRPRSPCPCSS
ncbi:MAG: hypothetical protein H0W83_15985 [Planctomycetes bacterium]|nr:hypothetical protein [Planctomycetota bacterium]